MKTSKQNASEIMEKIEKRKYIHTQIRKRVRRTWASVVVFAFLIPTTLFGITEDFTHKRPLSHPFPQEEPKEDDDSNSQMQFNGSNDYEIVLFM
jgi:hypothetical protein